MAFVDLGCYHFCHQDKKKAEYTESQQLFLDLPGDCDHKVNHLPENGGGRYMQRIAPYEPLEPVMGEGSSTVMMGTQ